MNIDALPRYSPLPYYGGVLMIDIELMNKAVRMISEYENLDYAVEQNRVVIKVKGKMIGEIMRVRRGIRICLKPATVRITGLYEDHMDIFEYRDADRHDNPFIFTGVKDMDFFLNRMNQYAEDIYNELNMTLNDRNNTLAIINSYLL